MFQEKVAVSVQLNSDEQERNVSLGLGDVYAFAEKKLKP